MSRFSIHNEADFDALFPAPAKIHPYAGIPAVRWWRRTSEAHRAPLHAVGRNRKTSCGLTVPAVAEVLGMASSGGPGWCRTCESTWIVPSRG